MNAPSAISFGIWAALLAGTEITDVHSCTCSFPTHTVTAIEPKWLTEVAPRFFRASDPAHISKRKKMEKIQPLFDKYAKNQDEWCVLRLLATSLYLCTCAAALEHFDLVSLLLTQTHTNCSTGVYPKSNAPQGLLKRSAEHSISGRHRELRMERFCSGIVYSMVKALWREREKCLPRSVLHSQCSMLHAPCSYVFYQTPCPYPYRVRFGHLATCGSSHLFKLATFEHQTGHSHAHAYVYKLINQSKESKQTKEIKARDRCEKNTRSTTGTKMARR